jgi:hypothetical protein
MRAEDYQRRREEVGGWPVGIVSYRLGDRFICEVDNASPGSRIARGEGSSREEAELAAVGDATRRLARTRIHDPEG